MSPQDQWRVTTVTGTQSGAGTDADVFIQVNAPAFAHSCSNVPLLEPEHSCSGTAIVSAVRSRFQAASKSAYLLHRCIAPASFNALAWVRFAPAIFESIWGPNGMLGGSEIYLEDSKNNFEKGSIDTFVLDFPVEKDCGDPIEKVGLWNTCVATPRVKDCV
eukprot:1158792-Pelagomonas_calceolata.AAC.3